METPNAFGRQQLKPLCNLLAETAIATAAAAAAFSAAAVIAAERTRGNFL